ncbi:septation ring formation regulator EzrA [Brevibacillus composti]|nr:septation ring formation regulator EzrA [Brevibacillus composti]
MKKKWILLCLAGMMLYSQPALATPFPEKTEEIVQDAEGLTNAKERAKFAEELGQLPGSYKVVIVESTEPEAQSPDEYAQKLFDNYNLSDEYLMVVLDINTEQLGVYPGPALQAKGATQSLLHDKITAYFEPFRNQKEYFAGIQTFLGEVEAELNRQQNQSKPVAATSAETSPDDEKQVNSGWLKLPWWLYAVGIVFAALSAGLVYAMFRRRSIFHQVDEVEDWKDELLEKINVIEVDNKLRRSSGKTEEQYLYLADRKENLLRNRMPDVEMMILDAEEACDRFRFKLALGILDEARETLEAIEQELQELKSDTTKVVTKKKESKLAIPEIGKQMEQVERRLSDLRLEYGLSFHELKAGLDDVESMRSRIQELRAEGDDVGAYDLTLRAQKILGKISDAIEQTPKWRERVLKEMPEEFRQLEDGIAEAAGDGYDLDRTALDNSLLQAKQMLTAARTALEEGNLELVETHAKAFEVLIDSTYQSIEELVLAQRAAASAAYAAAAAAAATPTAPASAPTADPASALAAAPAPDAATDAAFSTEESSDAGADTGERAFAAAAAAMAEAAPAAPVAYPGVLTGAEAEQDRGYGRFPSTHGAVQHPDSPDAPASLEADSTISRLEREELWKRETVAQDVAQDAGETADETTAQTADEAAGETAMSKAAGAAGLSVAPGEAAASTAAGGADQTAPAHPASGQSQYDENDEEDEYELVIPKSEVELEEEEDDQPAPPQRLDIRTEDEALDELERISNALVRVRQQIKRSYLPGVPEQLKYLFEDVVQILGRIQAVMESYRYDIEEVSMLINDANELLIETEQLAERTISTCQRAEGAIQYTNRYRRQNRQVNDLLSQAELAFRQLMFQEAYLLAEEARLLIEGAQAEPEKGWLLRRKKKG